METIDEIIPFAREMLNQRPGRSMLKIYALGSTLAVIGVVGGLLETVLQPFVEHGTDEDVPVGLILKEKKRASRSQTTLVGTEPEDVPETVGIEAKAKHLAVVGRRSSVNRLHAC